jgi:hypothetical protein
MTLRVQAIWHSIDAAPENPTASTRFLPAGACPCRASGSRRGGLFLSSPCQRLSSRAASPSTRLALATSTSNCVIPMVGSSRNPAARQPTTAPITFSAYRVRIPAGTRRATSATKRARIGSVAPISSVGGSSAIIPSNVRNVLSPQVLCNAASPLRTSRLLNEPISQGLAITYRLSSISIRP